MPSQLHCVDESVDETVVLPSIAIASEELAGGATAVGPVAVGKYGVVADVVDTIVALVDVNVLCVAEGYEEQMSTC